ncbi:extracellular solute-binding protein [Paenibacillus macerans]|uniref:extracellular solute-binding protein n=1 Tax=Paenibacillus macerans TaxID=44252 RepID=UPI002E204969|nr:extracellular solute-binding protein [Paenibacillus macerans]
MVLKKSFLSVLAAVLVIIAGCGAGTNTTGAPSGENGNGGSGSEAAVFSTSEEQLAAWNEFTEGLKGKWQGKTLNIVSVSDPWVESMTGLIKQFEDLTGASVNVSQFGYDAAYSREILTGSEQSSADDLFVYDVPWVGALSQYLLPLNDRLQQSAAVVDYDDFFGVMQKASTWEDNLLGMPFAPYFVMLAYNTQHFEAAKIDGPPATLDEYVGDIKAISENNDLPGVYGGVLNNQSGTAVGQAYFEYIYNAGGKPFESMYPGSEDPYADMTPLFSSPESLKVVKMFKDLLPYEPEGALNMSWNERASTFASGRAAMMQPWVTDIAPLSDPEKSTVTESYATAPAPTAEGVKQSAPVGGYSMGINRFSAQQDLAWDFLVWFTSPQTSYRFADTGGFPNRYSVLNDETLAGKYVYYATEREIVDTAEAFFRPQIPESFEIIDTLGTHIGEYLAGTVGLEEAMAAADQEIGAMLKKAGYTVND